jgi:hypothetical protein
MLTRCDLMWTCAMGRANNSECFCILGMEIETGLEAAETVLECWRYQKKAAFVLILRRKLI